MSKIVRRPYPAEIAARLAESGIAPLLARIYAARGIAAAAQLDTDIKRLLPFSLLKNAEKMARLLADAIAAHKKILIVADYDADGATACAVAMRGLTLLGARVDFIVPNRFEYGYGLTPEIVQLAAKSKPDILLTVDNGIASVEGVAEAHRLGMQVLVTDHHLPGDMLPDAECIVNPNQPGCEFPSKNLAGVGVMFYVLMALRAEMRAQGVFNSPRPQAGEGQGVRAEPNLGNLLDLVALGTVADVVKLDDNNRILVHQGLQRIRAGRSCAGIQALLRIARRQASQASSYELGFIVGPRLNAAGRLEDMGLGIRCLLTDDAAEANEIAARLDALNHERRSIEADMQDSALATLHAFDPADSFSLALFNEDWHQGVIGILASRLKDKFHRPVIAFAHGNEGELKGSGRSIAGLHLRDALDLVSKRHPHLIIKFGGHAMAAGLSIRAEHLDEFRQAFESVAEELLDANALVKTISTDGDLDAKEFSLAIARDLQRQVWGQGFPEPLFEGEFRVQSQRVVGEKHLKLKLSSPVGSYDAIRFFHADAAPDTVRAVYSLSVNEYNGNETLQLIVRHW
ncbi:MAG: single-stranded-DNA-specific exonuclease RecJ [Gammaproteobacteria bacterium]|nr:single-stranded-DNA-specific exonuclease RecJ [Gammaproteobacteria bacterium]MBU1775488.1 single-stranded-DNA-specific exonuclease RecJ [Gammaproteobacteria bacterium]MBU1968598.1 single-stranded-DNA-specific exonuclease RecJ [Gammaproteobacteria bacterium]